MLGDLVVDAMGRRSRMVRMLAEIGAAGPVEYRSDIGFRLYTRHLVGPTDALTWQGWSVRRFESVCVAMVSDGRSAWSVTLGIDDDDADLYGLADPAAWCRAATLYVPALSRLAEGLLPSVRVTGRLESHHRRLVRGGRPMVTGAVSVGEAWAASDPMLGLGLSMGLWHAFLLRDAVRDTGTPEDTVVRLDRYTERLLTPVHHQAVDHEARPEERSDQREQRTACWSRSRSPTG